MFLTNRPLVLCSVVWLLSLGGAAGCTADGVDGNVGDARAEAARGHDASVDGDLAPSDVTTTEMGPIGDGSTGLDAMSSVAPDVTTSPDGGNVRETGTDDSPAQAAAHAMLGPLGGSVRLAEGAGIIVPPVALTTTVDVSIASVQPPLSIPGGAPAGQAFVLGPDGQQFAAPVKLEIPFDLAILPPGTDPHHLVLAIAPGSSSDFARIETTFDEPRGLLVGETIHFSTLVPILPIAQADPLFVTSSSPLPSGTVGTRYGTLLTAKGGSPPYTWTLASGSLPNGLTLDGTGHIAGVPNSETIRVFTVRVTDSQQIKLEKAFSLTVAYPQNPIPVLTGLDPTHIPLGHESFMLTVSGSQFISSSVVRWNGMQLPTSYLGPSSLRAVVDATLLTSPGNVSVVVFNPAPGGGTSGQQTFKIDAPTPNPVPQLNSVFPTTILSGAEDTQISIYGSGFMAGAAGSVAFAGTTALTTGFVSTRELAAILPKQMLATAGTLLVHIVNPSPGGGPSADVAIEVQATSDGGSPSTDGGAPSAGLLTWGGPSNYTGSYRTVVDANGNSYIVGTFAEPIDFDPGPGVHFVTPTGGLYDTDGYLLKLDKDRRFISVWTFGGGRADIVNGVAIAADGSVYVSGFSYSGTLQILTNGATQISASPSVVAAATFLLKLTAAGNVQWTRVWSGGDQVYSYGVTLDQSENVYTAGSYGTTMDFDLSSNAADTHSPDSDGTAYLVSLTPSGDYRWARTFGGKWSRALALTSDGSGNLLLTGFAGGTGDFDPGPGFVPHVTQGFYDTFTSKFGPDGSYRWTRFIYGPGNDEQGTAVAADSNGDVYVTGFFAEQAEFDGVGNSDIHTAPGYGPGIDPSPSDAFLVRYDGTGNYVWGRSWGGNGSEYGLAVTTHPDFGVVVMGSFQQTVDFDPGPGSVVLTAPALKGAGGEPTRDMFVSTFNSAGQFRWVVSPGRIGGIDGAGLLMDPAHGLNVNGAFYMTADFDPGSAVLSRTAPVSHAFLWNLDKDGALAP